MSSRMLELQTIAALLINRHSLKVLDGLIKDPEAISFYEAGISVGSDNAVEIGRRMGKPPEYIRDTILPLAYEYGSVDIESNISVLKEMDFEKRELEAVRSILHKRESHSISKDEARTALLSLYRDSIVDGSGTLISTNNWSTKATAIYEANRVALASGMMPTFPIQFRRLREKIPYIFPGNIIAIVAVSGVGKTMLALQWAHWWAENHGRKVLYCLLEMNAGSVIARYVNRISGLPTMEIELGQHNATVEKVLKPYSNGGEVIFWECAGKSMPDLIAKAEELDADIILDTFNKLNVGNYDASNKTDRIAEANIELVTYLQKHSKMGVEVLQLDKSNTGQNNVGAQYAKDSIDFFQSCRYSFAMQFDIATETEDIEHPVPGRGKIRQYEGKPSVIGSLTIDKFSFGEGTGWQDAIFRDGGRSTIFEDPRSRMK